jgi:hypothetical protein
MTKTQRLVATLAVALLAATGMLPKSGAAPSTSPDSFSSIYQPVPKAQLQELASVPVKTLKTVGIGTTLRDRANKPETITAKPLRKSGKPELVFIDAEFCPFCASVRWGLTVALDRFGSFKGITTMHSSTTDIDADLQTLSYRYSTYRSKFLVFDPIVNEDVNQKHVESIPPHLKKIWLHYTQIGGYPFLYYGGRLVALESPIDPGKLKGLSRPTIAAALKGPTSKIAKAVDGEANVFTAAICQMTKGKPGRICSAHWVKQIAAGFPTYRKSDAF